MLRFIMSVWLTLAICAPLMAAGVALLVWSTLEMYRMKRAVIGHSMMWRSKVLAGWTWSDVMSAYVAQTGNAGRLWRARLAAFAGAILGGISISCITSALHSDAAGDALLQVRVPLSA